MGTVRVTISVPAELESRLIDAVINLRNELGGTGWGIDLGTGETDDMAGATRATRRQRSTLASSGDATTQRGNRGTQRAAMAVSVDPPKQFGPRRVEYVITRKNADINGQPGTVYAWMSKQRGPVSAAQIARGLRLNAKQTQSAVWALRRTYNVIKSQPVE